MEPYHIKPSFQIPHVPLSDVGPSSKIQEITPARHARIKSLIHHHGSLHYDEIYHWRVMRYVISIESGSK